MNRAEDILAFLGELSINNNREWFNANKSRFEALKQSFLEMVQYFLNGISTFDPELSGLEAKDCLFRIYRDIRFSPNKLPYKTHFGAYMAARGGRSSIRSGYYLHLEPDNCLISGGLWMPEPKLLKRVRQDVYDHADEFLGILNNPDFKAVYNKLDGEMLKRIPAGFPSGFEHEWLLRHKDFCVSAKVDDNFFTKKNWMNLALEYFKLQFPMHRFLNYSVDEYVDEA